MSIFFFGHVLIYLTQNVYFSNVHTEMYPQINALNRKHDEYYQFLIRFRKCFTLKILNQIPRLQGFIVKRITLFDFYKRFINMKLKRTMFYFNFNFFGNFYNNIKVIVCAKR